MPGRDCCGLRSGDIVLHFWVSYCSTFLLIERTVGDDIGCCWLLSTAKRQNVKCDGNKSLHFGTAGLSTVAFLVAAVFNSTVAIFICHT